MKDDEGTGANRAAVLSGAPIVYVGTSAGTFKVKYGNTTTDHAVPKSLIVDHTGNPVESGKLEAGQEVRVKQINKYNYLSDVMSRTIAGQIVEVNGDENVRVTLIVPSLKTETGIKRKIKTRCMHAIEKYSPITQEDIQPIDELRLFGDLDLTTVLRTIENIRKPHASLTKASGDVLKNLVILHLFMYMIERTATSDDAHKTTDDLISTFVGEHLEKALNEFNQNLEFEIQFHTAATYALKMSTHEYYEKIRDTNVKEVDKRGAQASMEKRIKSAQDMDALVVPGYIIKNAATVATATQATEVATAEVATAATTARDATTTVASQEDVDETFWWFIPAVTPEDTKAGAEAGAEAKAGAEAEKANEAADLKLINIIHMWDVLRYTILIDLPGTNTTDRRGGARRRRSARHHSARRGGAASCAKEGDAP